MTQPAARTVISREGETVDQICVREYRNPWPGAEMRAVLRANRGLSGYGVKLPAGVPVIIPELPSALTRVPLQKLWD
jgi:phage tail protein X